MRPRKPSIVLNCPANVYAGPQERIVEFCWVSQGRLYGGLIALHGTEDGLIVDVYRTDPGVVVCSATPPKE